MQTCLLEVSWKVAEKTASRTGEEENKRIKSLRGSARSYREQLEDKKKRQPLHGKSPTSIIALKLNKTEVTHGSS